MSQTLTLTPEKLVGAESLSDLSLSLDGKKALYSVSTLKSGDHSKSALWIADIGSPNSARQLTSGLFQDKSGVFTPDSETVLFLSDRHEAGKPSRLYTISLKGGEASQLFPSEAKKGTSSFAISPDGKHVAFTSSDELTAEDEKKKSDKDDAIVLGDKKDFARLRIFSYASGSVRTFDSITPARHVESFSWSPDSKEILYRLQEGNTVEYSDLETIIEKISIAPGAQPTHLGSYPCAPSVNTLWLPSGQIADIQSYEPSHIIDALAVHIRPLNDGGLSKSGHILYGETENASGIALLDEQSKDDALVVSVDTGVQTRVEIFDGLTKKFVLYETSHEGLGKRAVRKLDDGSYVMAAIKSSRVRGQPPNVWSGVAKTGEKVKLDVKLSAHNKWADGLAEFSSEVIEWKAEDGTLLQGLVSKRKDAEYPLPTVLLIHGGPYHRDTPSFTPHSAGMWAEMLADAGYLVLQPQYRGSTGRGSAFARNAAAGMGALDWSDCRSLLDLAVHEKKWADPSRLGIAGWSQGGFLTAWGVAQTKNLFKAAVMGAGVSDWGAMAAESDMPEFEAALGGSAPWTPTDRPRPDQDGSPIQFVQGVETAVLILHGKNDERVPAAQGVAYMRGLKREGKYPERSGLVLYPREGHVFQEKKHAEDVYRRVLDHFAAWL